MSTATIQIQIHVANNKIGQVPFNFGQNLWDNKKNPDGSDIESICQICQNTPKIVKNNL
jgi:hypothetical protein